ncbi:1-phosphofructokinase family hexose kinase [Kitasatospora sp. NPDC058965]|uniref:1-phosphofructokinase family hexose kinase n=1 Tax=Kitasatospora sp. NPDC058965 TaxID=3346682 RepID=UPI00367FC826
MAAAPILTVTLNAALDVTYQVPGVRLHRSNRVAVVSTRAGGKGINVARVVRSLGQPAVVTGLVGGAAGAEVRAALAVEGGESLLTVRGETRRTVAVVDPVAGDTTVFNEPGPTVTGAEWAAFQGHFGRLLDQGCGLVVLSGSLPPGVPVEAYGVLVTAAKERGVPVVLDTSAPWLDHGLVAGPDLVKPNADELRAATGEPDPLTAARQLVARGAGAVVASLGADGMLAVTADGCWRAAAPRQLAGNPTGAGDSAVAALAVGLLAGTPWPVRLAEAVALSGATVLSPSAGSYDEAAYLELTELVRVERL